MKKIKLTLLLLIALLQACLPTQEVEQIAVINSRGVDLIEENEETLVETTILPYMFDQNIDEITTLLTGRGHTIKAAREDAGTKSSKELSPGQIRLEVYGKKAAENGILPFLNTLIRDARVSDLMMLAVTNGSAKEILEAQQDEIEINNSQFMRDLIEKESEIYRIPTSYLFDFSRKVEKVGQDPVLPVIDIKENQPSLAGVGLFQNDKYVGQLSMQEAYLINQLDQNLYYTPIETSLPLEGFKDLITYDYYEVDDVEIIHIFLSLIKGSSRINLVDVDNLKFEATITLNVDLLENSVPISIETEKDIERVKKAIEKDLKKQFEAVFAKLQEVKSDPVGFGAIYHATREGSDITNDDWKEIFPESEVEFNIDLTIENFGTIY